MLPALVLATALLAPTAAPPLPPSLEGALQRHGPAMVAIHDKDGGVRPGFFVSSSGVAVAVVANLEDVVVELASGERRRARVLLKDDDGLALLEVVRLDKDVVFPSLALAKTVVVPSPQDWILGIGLSEGRVAPSVGGCRRVDERGRWRLDLPLDAGAPIFAGSRVIGVVVERAGTTASVAVSADRISALARRLSPGP